MFKLPTFQTFLIFAFIISATGLVTAQVVLDNRDRAFEVEMDTGSSPVGVVRLAEQDEPGLVQYGYYSKSGKPVRGFVAFTRPRGGKARKFQAEVMIRMRAGNAPFSFVAHGPNDAPVWTFDWVLFDDGTTWGPDDAGFSRIVLATYKGIQAALGQAEKIGLKPMPTQDSYGLCGMEPAPNTFEFDEKGDFERGFRHVLDWLLYPKGAVEDESQRDVVERLWAMRLDFSPNSDR